MLVGVIVLAPKRSLYCLVVVLCFGQIPEPCIQRAAEMASRLAREIASKEGGLRPGKSALETPEGASELQAAPCDKLQREGGRGTKRLHETMAEDAPDAVQLHHILRATSKGDPQELQSLQVACS